MSEWVHCGTTTLGLRVIGYSLRFSLCQTSSLVLLMDKSWYLAIHCICDLFIYLLSLFVVEPHTGCDAKDKSWSMRHFMSCVKATQDVSSCQKTLMTVACSLLLLKQLDAMNLLGPRFVWVHCKKVAAQGLFAALVIDALVMPNGNQGLVSLKE